MKDIRMYCLCLDNHLLSKVKKLNYIPVGLGGANFSSGWLRDNTGDNISNKNPYYGEYSFHYWFWKNELNKITDGNWVGFCAYRRFWLNDKLEINQDLKSNLRMFRILQGDVGSGKTIIAKIVALNSIESGYQCDLIAPTSILAEQHYYQNTAYLLGSRPAHRLGA